MINLFYKPTFTLPQMWLAWWRDKPGVASDVQAAIRRART